MELKFKKLSFKISDSKHKHSSTETKFALNNVSGIFEKKKFTALAGLSGSGKTCLLDAICGYRKNGVSAKSITLNGKEMTTKNLMKNICYIRQYVHLQPLLTVQESMMFVANLKLGKQTKLFDKMCLVHEILVDFNLLHCEGTLVKNLSGGELKRLDICIELISCPNVIVLDEPTTGLDTSTAIECLKILKNLVVSGKTVICSIHQPSMSMMSLFDNIYVMKNACCLYLGTVENLVPFLNANNFVCPLYHNPLEYMLELCILDDEDNAAVMCKSIKNGKCRKWLNMNKQQDENEAIEIIKDEKTEKSSDNLDFSYQFGVLLKRKIQIMRRHLLLTWLLLGASTMEGIFFGVLFYDSGRKADWIRFNFNLIFFLMVTAFFNGLFGKVITYPLEVKILRRECLNKWYSLKIYWLTTSIGDLFPQILANTIMSTSLYYLVGYPLEFDRILKFASITLIIALAGQEWGSFMGVNFSLQIALTLGLVTTLPALLFSGFFFFRKDCSSYLCRFGFDISIIRFGLEETFIAAYGSKTKVRNLTCSQPQEKCGHESPIYFFKEIDIDYFADTFYQHVFFLILYIIGAKIFSYFSLKLRVNKYGK